MGVRVYKYTKPKYDKYGPNKQPRENQSNSQEKKGHM